MKQVHLYPCEAELNKISTKDPQRCGQSFYISGTKPRPLHGVECRIFSSSPTQGTNGVNLQ